MFTAGAIPTKDVCLWSGFINQAPGRSRSILHASRLPVSCNAPAGCPTRTYTHPLPHPYDPRLSIVHSWDQNAVPCGDTWVSGHAVTRMGASSGTGRVRGSRGGGTFPLQAGARFQVCEKPATKYVPRRTHSAGICPGSISRVAGATKRMGMFFDFTNSLRQNTCPFRDVHIVRGGYPRR